LGVLALFLPARTRQRDGKAQDDDVEETGLGSAPGEADSIVSAAFAGSPPDEAHFALGGKLRTDMSPFERRG
jgi:hypothetical protein